MKKQIVLIMTGITIFMIIILLASFLIYSNFSKIEKEREDKEISHINTETGKITYKTDIEIEQDKEEVEEIKTELENFDNIKNDIASTVLNNKDGELIEGELKESLYLKMNKQLYRGEFARSAKVITEALEKYSIDGSCEDILNYYNDISLLILLNKMETIHTQDGFNAIKDDKVYVIGVIFSRVDIQLEQIPNESLVIPFDADGDEYEIYFLREEELNEEESIRLNERYFQSTFKKYIFDVKGEQINAYLSINSSGERIFDGFYYSSDEPNIHLSKKINW